MNSYRTKFSKVLTAMLIAIVLLTSQNAYAQKTTYDSRQIRFWITGGTKHTFNYLKIVGANQYNEVKSWEKSYTTYVRVAETKDYWWRDSIVITFSSEEYGRQQCIIDYLSLPSNNSKYVDITYDGRNCSGDSGNSAPVLKKEYDLLYAVIFSDEDTLKLLNELDGAYKPLECAKELANGIAANGIGGKVIRVVKVTSTCGNMAIDKVNKTLEPYKNRVERK